MTTRLAAATDESKSKPSQAPYGLFMPDALPAATLSISGFGDCLRDLYPILSMHPQDFSLRAN